MKLYLSADMEGTAGIVNWNETTPDHPQYGYFREQMTREVAAACEGALDAGADEIIIKDAHDSARNIIPSMLPEQTRLFRGWDDTPEMMMAGIDSTFDGVLFTGYHAAACTSVNPLSHTMSLKVQSLKCNGRLLSEFDINAMIAAQYGVPIFFLSGDEGLCQAAKETLPHLMTVGTNEGRGGGAISMHPETAVKQIHESVKLALRSSTPGLYPMPAAFSAEICYKEHSHAARAACYPGVTRKDAKTVALHTGDFRELLTAFFWIL